MKKKMLKVVAITGLFVAAGVVQAQAAYDDYYAHLMRAVFNASGTDVDAISDLGAISSLSAGSMVGVDGFDLTDFADGTDYGDLKVAYFGVNSWKVGRTTYNEAWFSSSRCDLTLTDVTAPSTLNFVNGWKMITGTVPGYTDWTVPQSDGGSYSLRMNTNGMQAGLLQGLTGAVSLAGIDAGATADLYLYHWDGNVNDGYTLTNLGMEIKTGADYTQIADASCGGSPVPIPGAVWLLGSGLAGFIGLRRKNS